jgi:two-component system, cell cycle response regulator DivK
MPHTFDSAGFGELGADAERLTAQAAEHERRLAALVESVENNREDSLLATLRELCVDARQQRQIAHTIRARLLGDIAPAGPDTGKRPLVLIVDDSQDNREMAAMLLETSGFDAITAGNGLEGVIVAHYTRPSVVIMDVAMPVLDGVQATKLLKASPVTQTINVIAYTAKMSMDDAPMTRLFADVLQKPASPETIVGLVQRFALPGAPEAV